MSNVSKPHISPENDRLICEAALVDDGKRGARLAADERFEQRFTPDICLAYVSEVVALRDALVKARNYAQSAGWIADEAISAGGEK